MNSSRPAWLLPCVAVLAACGGGDAENKPPVAAMVLAPTSGDAPLVVTADATTSSDPDGTIESWAWDFGDGTTATGAQATHTYANPGEYTVTLTVKDDEGAKGTATGKVLALGTGAAFDASTYDGATYLEEPASGTLDTTILQ